jgi:hypothetical protein
MAGSGDICWQRFVWFSVDPDSEHLALVSGRGSPIPDAVSHAAHHAWWPYRLPALAGQHHHWE